MLRITITRVVAAPGAPEAAPSRRRRFAAIATAVALVTLVPAAAFAVLDPDGPSTEVTACVKSTGAVVKAAVGSAPLSACASGEIEVHMKSGDVTAVIAGTGMEGGASSGPATLSLAPSYRLPQGCADGQVAKIWSGSWGCYNDTDTNTTYMASTGLAMVGNAMYVKPSYRLPQTCIPGQYVTWINGTSMFGCTFLPADAGETPYKFGPYSVTSSGAGKPCSGTPNTPIPLIGNGYTTSAFTIAKGKWRPVVAGASRWSIYKAGDLDTYSRTYSGSVKVEIVDAQNAVVSSFVRNDQTNGLGDGQHADQDFTSFSSIGGQYRIKLAASGVGCTSSQLLDFSIELEKVD